MLDEKTKQAFTDSAKREIAALVVKGIQALATLLVAIFLGWLGLGQAPKIENAVKENTKALNAAIGAGPALPPANRPRP